MELWAGLVLTAVAVTVLWLVLRKQRSRRRTEVEFPDEVPEFSGPRPVSSGRSGKNMKDEHAEGEGGDGADGGGGGGGD